MDLIHSLNNSRELRVRQRKELAELFGFETRNKYEIKNEHDTVIGFAAEQGKGFGAALGRHFLGHWRRFEIFIFDNTKQMVLRLEHPFNFLFQRIEVYDASGKHYGAIQQRFALLRKRFDVEASDGMRVLLKVVSPIFSPWTFTFYKNDQPVAVVKKRWSGFFKEMMTDADNFSVLFEAPSLTPEERGLILASAMFIDVNYFEKKAD